jgi:hypothetical protein
MSDPLKPSVALLSKIGSIVVHAEEMLSAKGHEYDRQAILSGLQDPELREWIKAMGAFLPQKR